MFQCIYHTMVAMFRYVNQRNLAAFRLLLLDTQQNDDEILCAAVRVDGFNIKFSFFSSLSLSLSP